MLSRSTALQAFRTSTVQVVKHALRTVGYELQRIRSRSARPSFYYAPTESCQIPYLGFLYELFLGRKSDGVFVEVGAFDGLSFSNSSCLANVGWRGLLVEPVPQFARLCRDRYASNPRVDIVEAAVGASEATIQITVASALSTANPALAQEYKGIPWSKNQIQSSQVATVALRPLDSILDAWGVTDHIDVLIVDVEGFESEVFRGFNLARWRPTMMIIELCDTHPDLASTRSADAALTRHILASGYEIVYKDAINTVFVSAECSRSILGSQAFLA